MNKTINGMQHNSKSSTLRDRLDGQIFDDADMSTEAREYRANARFAAEYGARLRKAHKNDDVYRVVDIFGLSTGHCSFLSVSTLDELESFLGD